MKRYAAILLASVALSGCDAVSGPTATTIECSEATQTECLNDWLDTKFEEYLAFSPILQTSLGIKTDYGALDQHGPGRDERNRHRSSGDEREPIGLGNEVLLGQDERLAERSVALLAEELVGEGDRPTPTLAAVWVDPSANSFLLEAQTAGLPAQPANNAVTGVGGPS